MDPQLPPGHLILTLKRFAICPRSGHFVPILKHLHSYMPASPVQDLVGLA